MFSFILCLLSFKFHTSEVIAMKSCRYDYYYSRTNRACLPCEVSCPPEHGLNYNCGYNEHGNRVKAGCSRCKEGFYSPGFKKNDNEDSRPTFCKKCKSCPPREKIVRSCTRLHDAQCCPLG